VSNLGRVRSLGRDLMRKSRYGTMAPYHISGRVLKPLHSQGDYCYVHLFDKDGASINHKVHRLVAKAFVPNPDNLEWCKHAYNCNYGTRNERSKAKRSEPVQQLDADGNVVAEYPSSIEAQRATGINRKRIRMCCKGKYKTAGGYRWRFKE